MAAQLMTQVEFARHRGVGKSAVSNWKRDGLVVFAEGPGGRQMVDVGRTDARLNAKIDPMRGRPSTASGQAPDGEAPALPLEQQPLPSGAPSPPTERTLNAERIEQVREQRIGQAMKNAQLAGELVPLVEAQKRVAEVGRSARERMHAWFRSQAERLAAEKDVRQVMAIGESGIDQVFAELADAADSGEFAGDDVDADLTAEEVAEMDAVEAESVP